MLRLQLLGEFRATVSGQSVDDRQWTRKSSKTLIKLLALAPRRQMHREQIIETIWPEVDGARGLNQFHKAVHAARRVLEPGLQSGSDSLYLITRDSQILLDQTEIDCDEFERAAREALGQGTAQSLEAAIARYTAPLLEEDRYESWATLRREQLQLLAEQVLDRLAACYESSDRPEAAIQPLRRLIAVSPLNEDAHRRIMRLYARDGRRDLGLQQFQTYAQILESELGAAPEPETLELARSLRMGTLREDVPPAGPASAGGERSSDAGPAATVEKTPDRSGAHRARTRRYMVAGLVSVVGLAAIAGVMTWLSHDHPVDSVAVLPVRVSVPGVEAESLAGGITEGLIARLSRIPGLLTMARATVFRYKDKTVDPKTIGRELNVKSVLLGELQQDRGSVRLYLELVSTADGRGLWSDRFSFSADRLASWEDEVLPLVTQALHRQVSGSVAPTPEPPLAEAYRQYLLGRLYAAPRTRAGLERAASYFEHAVALQPSYAPAWAGIADVYGLLAFRDAPPANAVPRAREAALKSIEIDPGSAEGHTSLAMIRVLYDWDFDGAEREFRAAIACNPGYSTAHHWYGVNLAAYGRFDEATRELSRALQLDPLSPIVNDNSGYPHYFQGKWDLAETAYRRALEIDPTFAIACLDLARLSAARGDQAQAISWVLKHLRFDGRAEQVPAIESAHRREGYRAAMRTWLDQETERARHAYVEPVFRAELAVAAGRKAEALDLLETAAANRSAALVYAGVDPAFRQLGDEPRFRALMRSISAAR